MKNEDMPYIPQVGVECEAIHPMVNNGNWFKVQTLKKKENNDAMACHLLDSRSDNGNTLLWLTKFRPLKTQAEIEREELESKLLDILPSVVKESFYSKPIIAAVINAKWRPTK